MIFTFLDDNTLDVHDDDMDINVAYEAIDLKNGEYSFFDSGGYELRPRLQAPIQKKILGLFPYHTEGAFELTRGECKREEVLAKLDTIAAVNKNPWFKSVIDVRNFLLAAK